MYNFETTEKQRKIIIKLLNNLIDYTYDIYYEEEFGYMSRYKGKVYPDILFIFDALKALNYSDYDYYFDLFYNASIEKTLEAIKQLRSGTSYLNIDEFDQDKFRNMLLKELLELIFYKGKYNDILRDKFVSDSSINKNSEFVEYYNNVINNFNILIEKNILPSNKNISLVLSNPKTLQLNGLERLNTNIVKEEQTKKITLNELRTLVKQIINEESDIISQRKNSPYNLASRHTEINLSMDGFKEILNYLKSIKNSRGLKSMFLFKDDKDLEIKEIDKNNIQFIDNSRLKLDRLIDIVNSNIADYNILLVSNVFENPDYKEDVRNEHEDPDAFHKFYQYRKLFVLNAN